MIQFIWREKVAVMVMDIIALSDFNLHIKWKLKRHTDLGIIDAF